MKAIGVFPQTRTIEIVDVPEPELHSSTSVKVRILEIGICGTDKEIARFDYGTPPDGSDFLILGHEAIGEIVEVGDDVEGLVEGDLVVPMVRRPCGHEDCLACQQGRQDFCYTGDFTERGINKRHGFSAQYVVDEAEYFVKLSPHLREIGVLVEPLTIAEKAMEQIWDIQERLPWACRDARESGEAPELQALVLGAGPVGLLGAMLLMINEFETYVYSLEPADSEKAKLVRSLGGHYVSGADVKAEHIQDAVGRVDLVYEATGASGLAFEVLDVLDNNAVFCFTGVPGRKAPIEVDTSQLMRDMVLKNQLIFGTVNAGRQAFEDAARDLASFRDKWPDAVSGLITGHYAMERYQDLLSGREGGIKNVVNVADAG